MSSQLKPETIRILFVDDNEDLRSMMTLLMQRKGYLVTTADCAATALELAPEWQPHIVVSDIGMPGTDGYELLRTLRADLRLKPFRAIALSGFGHMVEADAAQAAGFDVRFEKPVDFDRLFATIAELETDISLDRLTCEDIAMPSPAEGEAGHPLGRNPDAAR